MIKIKDVVMDTAGNGVHRATVAITQYPSGEAATLYSDNGITALPSNSVLTDDKGQYEFYIPNGRYTRTVSKTGATTVTDTDIIQAYDGSGITIATGKAFTVSNSITLAGTDGTTITLPSATTALAGIDGAQTFTGLQTFANGIQSGGAVELLDTLEVAGPSQFTTIAASGAVAFSSTLGVTGLSTLGSLTVTGATTLNSLTLLGTFNPTQITTGAITSTALSFFNAGLEATTVETSGVATLATATITGNSTVGGTLGVTGLATFNSANVTADLSVGDDLTVTGDASLGGVVTLGGKTITLGGNLTTSGASAITLTSTGTTTLTLPTSGTLLSNASTVNLTQLSTGGSAEGDVMTIVGGVWVPAAPSGGSGGAGSFTTLAASGATTLSSTLAVTGAVQLGTTGGGATYVDIGKSSTETALRLYGRGSGSAPRFEAIGFDSAIDIQYSTKLTGAHKFYTRSFSSTGLQFEIADTFSADNYYSITGGDNDVATTYPILSVKGVGTNIDARITPKGTGMLSTTGIKIDEGSNKRMGVTAAMTAGSITVSTTAVTANSRIFLTAQTTGGTAGALRVSARTAGTSFTITSTSGSDTSTVAWMIMEPA